METVIKILKFVFFTPFYAFCIWFDRVFFNVNKGRSNPFLTNKIPRNLPEVFKFSSPPEGKWLFDTIYEFLIQKEIEETGDMVRRKKLQFISCNALGGSVHEPDKSVLRVEIKYRVVDADEQRLYSKADAAQVIAKQQSLNNNNGEIGVVKTYTIFIKLPTCRPVGILFKALVSTFSTPSVREVNVANLVIPFLQNIAAERGFEHDFKTKHFVVPRSIKASWSRVFDRSMLIAESIDMNEFHSNPDWIPLSLDALHLMHDTISYMHAMTWRKVGPATPNPRFSRSSSHDNATSSAKFDNQKAVANFLHSNYTEREGADWLDAVIVLYLDATTPVCKKMWGIIKKRLAKAPLALCHADFRGGNMLFSKDFKKMVITDWEANSIAPFMWDVTYSTLLALPPDVRRKEQRDIVARYLKNLETNPHFRLNRAADQIPSLDECMDLFKVCLMTLQYFGWVLRRFGGVGETQGNSENDVKVWEKKVAEGLEDVFADAADFAKAFEVSEDEAKELIAGLRSDWEKGVGCFTY